MAVHSPSSDDSSKSSNRRQKKSRQGCANCKLRAVKCDENKPSCRRCTTYGVQCHYGQSSADLQLSFENVNTIQLPNSLPLWLTKDDELLSKFQNRTALTVSTGDRLRLYQSSLVDMSQKFPFVYHAILALTLMHDRMINQPVEMSISSDEAYHMYKGIAGFHRALRQPLSEEEKLAVFCVSAILGNASIVDVTGTTWEECWPLSELSGEELTWVVMCAGKTRLPGITDPSGPLTSQAAIQAIETAMALPPPPSGLWLKTLPIEFARLFDFDCKCEAVVGLAAAMHTQERVPAIIRFLRCISSMPPRCYERLKQKNPLALILLAWWYTKFVQMPLWWARRRGLMEGKAICKYLEMNFAYDGDIQTLLRYPKTIFWNTKLPNII